MNAKLAMQTYDFSGITRAGSKFLNDEEGITNYLYDTYVKSISFNIKTVPHMRCREDFFIPTRKLTPRRERRGHRFVAYYPLSLFRLKQLFPLDRVRQLAISKFTVVGPGC